MSDVKTAFHYREQDDSITIQTYQDVAPYLEANKRAYNNAPEFGRYNQQFTKLAEIPNNVLIKFYQMGLNYLDENDWPKIRKIILTDPEFKYLRTMPGKM